MARQDVAVTAAVPYNTAGALVTETAADTTNKERIKLTGREILIAHNSGGSSRTVTIDGVSFLGRDGAITAESIAAGAIRRYGPFDPKQWRTAAGYLEFEASHADVKWSVLTF